MYLKVYFLTKAARLVDNSTYIGNYNIDSGFGFG